MAILRTRYAYEVPDSHLEKSLYISSGSVQSQDLHLEVLGQRFASRLIGAIEVCVQLKSSG
jgi:hypothetical protein